ncbi:MAG: NAD(P)H-binding protein [Acidobacteriaceae bacterium]|nr:NAD(P)H-binding protein [Acidobacteriaceae bacterium]
MGTTSGVFITGSTGYIGSRLVPLLLNRGHRVKALLRPQSSARRPVGCIAVPGDALQGDRYRDAVQGCDTFIHLVGVSHPSPAKAQQFRDLDGPAAMQAFRVAQETGVRHFIYLSVAHPAPVMRDYIEVRTRCEAVLRDTGLNATIVRPWYVLGPGHRWPYGLIPFYRVAELFPATRDGAVRLGLVTIGQMLQTLVRCVENPCEGIRILEPKDIRARADLV